MIIRARHLRLACVLFAMALAVTALPQLFGPRAALASCPDITVSYSAIGTNQWKNRIIDELVSITTVIRPSSGCNQNQIKVVEPNTFQYRNCNGIVQFTGPPVFCAPGEEPPTTIAQTPLALTQIVPPMVMLSLSNDHQLYFEAYPDYADITGNGFAEQRYNHVIDYYGYFDSYKCYDYNTISSRFEPKSVTNDKYCGGGTWSGNFLNYVTMARIDVIRQILYGGHRSTDTSDVTVLERSYIPTDAHSWVRYYDGEDMDRLTPFELPGETITVSDTKFAVPSGSRNDAVDRIEIWTDWRSTDHIQVGDQLVIRSRADPDNVWMHAVAYEFEASDGRLRAQVTRSSGPGTVDDNWLITNHSRRGISFCNTTEATTTWSHDVKDPPLMKVASGNYNLWTANEKWQCRWLEDASRHGFTGMDIGGQRFSNGNDFGVTGLKANSENASRNQVGLGQRDYSVRVRACVDGIHNRENCRRYPDGNYKPVGLLQTYGEDDSILFGLITGSYMKNKSGGVVRRNIGSITNEIKFDTNGTFLAAPSGGGIIDTLGRLRIYGYSHSSGNYNDSSVENCPWGLASFSDGRCTNWGNPQSEIFLEGLRYFAGAAPTSAFTVTGTDRISGLTALTSWDDPLNADNWCSALRMIHFNASVSSYDHDQLSGASALGIVSLDTWTDKVGQGEGIHGTTRFVGQSGIHNDQLCTAKPVTALSNVRGVCPLAPRLQSSYQIAGLAHYAYTQSIRNDLLDGSGNKVPVQVKTYGVALAPAVPRIQIPRPGGTEPAVEIIPACRNTCWPPGHSNCTSSGNCAPNCNFGNCSIVDFRVVEQDLENGTGSFFIQWEDSEQGGDYDMDMNGILRYHITNSKIEVTTEVVTDGAGLVLGFGYIMSGTTNDGFQVHSGITNFSWHDGPCTSASPCNAGDPPTSREFALGESPGRPLEDPLYYAAKWGGFHMPRTAHDPQFPADQASWDRSGDGQPDNYFYAINPGALATALQQVFATVARSSAAIAALATNSTELRPDADAILYQARFDSRDWTGDVWALEFNPADLSFVDRWKAKEELPSANERRIFTHDGSQGVEFTWSEISALQKSLLGSEGVLEYVRGDASNEVRNGGEYRNRSTPIGSIIHSTAIYQGAAINFGHVEDTYNDFRRANQDRAEVVYVGSNGGMLHAFEANTGEELFAYVPRTIVPKLANLIAPDYQHQYMVDGQQYLGHAQIAGAWRAVLVGTLGGGGRGVYALDVTDPESFDAGNVLWEISAANLPELGYTYGRPIVAKMADGTWAAIFANGYDSPSGKAALLVVNLATGAVIREIDTGATGGNGLSAPAFVSNDERQVYAAFAGDLKGNLWKFDFGAANPTNWGSAFTDGGTPKPLFEARGPDGEVQPITGEPAAGKHPNGGYIVYFGTGQYFRIGDNQVEGEADVQSAYGIRDAFGAIDVSDKTDFFYPLQQQTIVAEGEVAGLRARVVSQNDIEDDARGWYLDLIHDGKKEGERIVIKPLLLDGRIEFVSMVPSQAPCDVGGTSFLYTLDAISGGRIDAVVYDLSGDGAFDKDDMILVGGEWIAPSGVDPGIGIIGGAPTIITDPATGRGYRIIAGTIGPPRVDEFMTTGGDIDRESWRQLR